MELTKRNCGCAKGTQTHVHEFLGSTKLAEEGDDRHNHRFAGVTSQVIPQPCGGHKHALLTNTDFFENHHHEIGVLTGIAIVVGPNDKHVHFVDGDTTLDNGHCHLFQFTTLIQSPLT
ncbi:MAG TPA: YmaF family protein [Desulfosporosinus sp.]|nr:YmaF family protein [Desulfosporosinus sp.]